MALSDFQDLVDNLVRDESGEITVVHRDQAVDIAVTRYSTDRPRTMVEAVTADGSSYLDLPPSWVSDVSALKKVSNVTGGYEVAAETDLTIDGLKIKLAEGSMAGATYHVYFTTPHALTDLEDTIPKKDREAVAGWAAAFLFEQLASLYSGDREPTIDADKVDFGSKGRDYAARAKRLRQAYLDHFGIDPKRTVPAGVVVDLDRPDQRGRDRIFHSQRRR